MAKSTLPALTARQRAAAALDAGDATINEISQATGASPRTISRWRACQSYQIARDTIGAQIFMEGFKRLRAVAPLAAAEIKRILIEGKGDSVRLRAAVTVFDLVSRHDLEAQVADLEARLESLEHAPDAVGFVHGHNNGTHDTDFDE